MSNSHSTATHCNTVQHTATICNTLQHTETQRNTLLHTATHCNTLQHTATHLDCVYTRIQSRTQSMGHSECDRVRHDSLMQHNQGVISNVIVFDMTPWLCSSVVLECKCNMLPHWMCHATPTNQSCYTYTPCICGAGGGGEIAKHIT